MPMKKALSHHALSELQDPGIRRRGWGSRKKQAATTIDSLDLSRGSSIHSLDTSFFWRNKRELLDDPTNSTHASADEYEAGCLKVRTQRGSITQRYGSLQKPERNVTWGSLDIHSHVVTLGDNPSVSTGPPLTVAWKACKSHTITIDDYEAGVSERRSRRELAVPRQLREEWLRDVGFSRMEMRQVNKEIIKIKSNRKSSAEDGKLWEKLRRWTYSKNGRKLDPSKVLAE